MSVQPAQVLHHRQSTAINEGVPLLFKDLKWYFLFVIHTKNTLHNQINIMKPVLFVRKGFTYLSVATLP